MGKMSELHLGLQGIREVCENAPNPRPLPGGAEETLDNYNQRIGWILEFVNGIEEMLSGTSDFHSTPLKKALLNQENGR